jgi:hypothetical protein
LSLGAVHEDARYAFFSACERNQAFSIAFRGFFASTSPKTWSERARNATFAAAD